MLIKRPPFILLWICLFSFLVAVSGCHDRGGAPSLSILKKGFLHPPDSARPGVYWYFMDGNMSRRGIREDLQSMKRAGIGRVIFLEVNVGVPRGPVDFLSPEWYRLFDYAEKLSAKLGIAMTLGVGPGWAGSGGPWITPQESMQQLVASAVRVTGPSTQKISLPLPRPKEPYFGEGIFTPALKKQWEDYYKDVAVLAFPTPEDSQKIKDINAQALYYRAPFSSVPGVKPFLSALSDSAKAPAGALVPQARIIDLSGKLRPDGTLRWEVPAGKWTILRFVSRNNGAMTRPAPEAGLGFECSKLDTTAVNAQLDAYVGKILRSLGKLPTDSPGGLKTLHLDSWEMGAQNWTPEFRKEFIHRRGYDPLPYFPVYDGYIVGSLAKSRRFLWDLRQTCNEMVQQYYAGQLKKYAHRHGLNLSIEPYDMNPSADLELGAVADVPMGEFWSKGYGYNTSFSCLEATSIAHVEGESIVQSESFTSDGSEAWKQYPGSMKNQGDWALATGINRFYYHTFADKPWSDSLRPGMTMGPYGVHWDRKQTWWPLAGAYHLYITRCQYLLQQGKAVADVLYLTPEGAPLVFQPPPSALSGGAFLPDRKGYNFDGCSPEELYRATVKDGALVFPGGAHYQLLVLPAGNTMTPALVEKVASLIHAGATVVGAPPVRSPSLSGYPGCDSLVRAVAEKVWGALQSPVAETTRSFGAGKVIWGDSIGRSHEEDLYPPYRLTAAILRGKGIPEDFSSAAPVRYTHRASKDWDIYFVSNTRDSAFSVEAVFASARGTPSLWDPMTGKTRQLPQYTLQNGKTILSLRFAPWQSYFIVFAAQRSPASREGKNFYTPVPIDTLPGPWAVSFVPKAGGPARVTFDSLTDWTRNPEKGIRYYSGIATYRKTFVVPVGERGGRDPLYLGLGRVEDMARVLVNGHDAGVVWTAPWRVNISPWVKPGKNQLEIRVANRWCNRLIGDQHYADDGVKNGQWPSWLLNGQKRPSRRITFTNYNPYGKDTPLLSSGLLGPVTLQVMR